MKSTQQKNAGIHICPSADWGLPQPWVLTNKVIPTIVFIIYPLCVRRRLIAFTHTAGYTYSIPVASNSAFVFDLQSSVVISISQSTKHQWRFPLCSVRMRCVFHFRGACYADFAKIIKNFEIAFCFWIKSKKYVEFVHQLFFLHLTFHAWADISTGGTLVSNET